MAVGSLVGFALAFVVLAWTLSLAGAAAMALARTRLRRAGAASERRAAAFATVVPPALAMVALGIATVAERGAADHCVEHSHHVHLCFVHGGAWAERAIPSGLVAALAAAAVIALVRGVVRVQAARRATHALCHVGTPTRVGDVDVVVAPCDRRLSVTAGLVRSRVIVSTAVWAALDAPERAALVAHEQAHAESHDVFWGVVLGVASRFSAPRVGPWLCEAWREATERLRDQDAAAAVGDGLVVASALVKVARIPPLPALPLSLGLSPDVVLAARVEALLADPHRGDHTARWLGAATAGLLIAGLLAAPMWTGPLHHTLETLLALL